MGKERPGTIEVWRNGGRGTAAIEFALIAPVLVILLAGIVETGFATYQKMQIENAAEAGAHYAARNGWDPAGISAAIVSGTGAAGITASPAPQQFCGCPTANGITAAACGTTCLGGNPAESYVQVNASAPRTSILPYAGSPLPATLTAQAVVRLQ